MSQLHQEQKQELDLVLSSSGVRAPVFIGGIKAVEEKGYRIKRIAGVSGGAVVGAGYALGLSTQEMEQAALNLDYSSLKDLRYRKLFNRNNPSLCAGEKLDSFYREVFGNAQLKDFQIECNIVVAAIGGARKRVVLNKDTYPNLPVWQAVRMSSSLPFIFPYLTLENRPLVDGGLMSLTTQDVFPNRERTVLCLKPRAGESKRGIFSTTSRIFLWEYAKAVLERVLDALDNEYTPGDDWDRTIVIPTQNIGGFYFNIKREEVRELISSGYKTVLESAALPDLSELCL